MASIKKIEGRGDVSYKITVSMGRDAQDRQVRHYRTWKPDQTITARQMEKEVKRVAYEFERDLEIGYQADNRQTFEQYAAYVYSLHEQRGDRPQSIALFKRSIERVSPYIGHLKLKDIRPQHLNNMYKAMMQPGINRRKLNAKLVSDIDALAGDSTWKDFADKCGVDVQVIKRLRKGQLIKPMNAKRLKKI